MTSLKAFSPTTASTARDVRLRAKLLGRTAGAIAVIAIQSWGTLYFFLLSCFRVGSKVVTGSPQASKVENVLIIAIAIRASAGCGRLWLALFSVAVEKARKGLSVIVPPLGYSARQPSALATLSGRLKSAYIVFGRFVFIWISAVAEVT